MIHLIALADVKMYPSEQSNLALDILRGYVELKPTVHYSVLFIYGGAGAAFRAIPTDKPDLPPSCTFCFNRTSQREPWLTQPRCRHHVACAGRRGV